MLEKFGLEKVEAFCELNAYKYQYRHELKNGEEDLQKAENYKKMLQEIRQLEKIYPKYFKAVRLREKNFELRKDEDDIQVGDLLILEEWDGYYTGEGVRRYVKYVLRDCPEIELMPGYCIIGW